MSKVYIMYNPLAGNGTCEEDSHKLNDIFIDEDISYIDLCTLDDDRLNRFFKGLDKDDKVVLCGGDGTISHFINAVEPDQIKNEVLYFPAGSGNDFYHDVDADRLNGAIPLNKYIVKLPTVEVNGIKRKFINGIGFGIDGYCCEEGDKLREKKRGKKVNYTPIALKGLIYGFSRVNATVIIDGEVHEYTDVWMVPTMNGRYYGGGMMCAPNQDRLYRNNQVSVIVVSSKSRIRLLTAFSSIYDGGHLKYDKICTEYKASSVTVKFDRPTSLQIDGDTIRDVTEYSVYM